MTETWLRWPRAPLLALLAAAGLALPTVGLGYMLDDFFHVATLEGMRSPSSPLDLFRFLPGTPEQTKDFVASGPFPWWTGASVKLAFLRPLTSALAFAEHALFGRAPALNHLHSILWYLALVFVVGGVLRRMLEESLAAVALLLFAIDDVHWMPVGWLANRNALVAAVPMFAALWAHIRWREEGWKPGLPLSVLLMAAGLAGGEAALGVFAFFAGYEVALGPGQRKDQLKALAPAALVLVVYAVVYKSLGYGALGSGVYLDPVHSPRTYLWALPGRVLALAGCQLLSFPADFWAWAPQLRAAQVVVGAVGVGLFVWLGRRMWHALTKRDQRGLVGLTVGGVLALGPVCATFPGNRLLLLPSIAGAAWVAALLRHAWRRRGAMDRVVVAGLLLFHVVLAVAAWPLLTRQFMRINELAHAAIQDVEVPDEGLAQRRLVLLNAPDMAVGMYPMLIRYLDGHPLPRAWWPLTFEARPLEITRTAPNALEITALSFPFVGAMFEQLTRSPELPFTKGDRVQLDGAAVTVLATDGPFPLRIRFETEVPLEDPSLLILEWRNQGLRRFALPPQGTTVTLGPQPGLLKP